MAVTGKSSSPSPEDQAAESYVCNTNLFSKNDQSEKGKTERVELSGKEREWKVVCMHERELTT